MRRTMTASMAEHSHYQLPFNILFTAQSDSPPQRPVAVDVVAAACILGHAEVRKGIGLGCTWDRARMKLALVAAAVVVAEVEDTAGFVVEGNSVVEPGPEPGPVVDRVVATEVVGTRCLPAYVPSARTVWVFVENLEVEAGDMQTSLDRRVVETDTARRVGVDTLSERAVGYTEVGGGLRTGIVTIEVLASGWNRSMSAVVVGRMALAEAAGLRMIRSARC